MYCCDGFNTRPEQNKSTNYLHKQSNKIAQKVQLKQTTNPKETNQTTVTSMLARCCTAKLQLAAM
jgi:hypothetical protein